MARILRVCVASPLLAVVASLGISQEVNAAEFDAAIRVVDAVGTVGEFASLVLDEAGTQTRRDDQPDVADHRRCAVGGRRSGRVAGCL